jgi:hypothetical protein
MQRADALSAQKAAVALAKETRAKKLMQKRKAKERSGSFDSEDGKKPEKPKLEKLDSKEDVEELPAVQGIEEENLDTDSEPEDSLRDHIDVDEISNSPEWEKKWDIIFPMTDFGWKAVALKTLKEYTQRTDGSWIEDKEYGIVWHFENADPEYGRLQSNELSKYLTKVLDSSELEVIEYEYNRILEVKPKGASKGYAARHILRKVLGDMQPFSPQSATLDPASLPVSKFFSHSASSSPTVLARLNSRVFVLTARFLVRKKTPRKRANVGEVKT